MGRPISDHQRRWLSNELGHWLTLGLIRPEQGEAIRGCYETPEQFGQRKRALASFTLAAVAALLVGLGVMLLVGHNWQLVVAGWEALPKAIKLAAMLLVIGGVQGTALYVRRNTPYRRTSEVLFLLGSFLYGVGIWLVAQVFHVSAHWPDGIWWWALGVVPLALLMDTVLLHALAVGLLGLWVGGEIIGFGRLWWGLLPNGCYSLPLLAAAGLLWSYRKGSAWAVSLYVALTVWWVILQGFAWDWEYGLFFFIAAAGPMLLIVAENHRPASPMSVPYRVMGALLAAGGLVPLSFVDFHQSVLAPYHSGEPVHSMLIVVVLAGLLAVTLALSALLKPPTDPRAGPFGRLIELYRRHAVPLAIAAATVLMALLDGAAVSNAAVLSAVTGNVAMVALALWLMRTGLRDERGQAFAGGVLYLLLWAVIRYVDLFGSHLGMLGGAAMFISCGLALFALAMLWRNRKEILPEKVSGTIFAEEMVPDTFVSGVRQAGLLAGGIGLQLAVLAVMTGMLATPLLVGQTILLRTEPVDPRDLFRGDYVRLGYEIARVPPGGVAGLDTTGPHRSWRHGVVQEQTVYVGLEPEADGRHYRAAALSTTRPASGKYIKGTYARDWGPGRITFGIESFYVPEGTGRKYEEAQRSRRLAAEVALTTWGQAALRDLKFE